MTRPAFSSNQDIAAGYAGPVFASSTGFCYIELPGIEHGAGKMP
jgi:hypothetical protein